MLYTTQDESLQKQDYARHIKIMQILLGLQIILGVTIQPYLLYKLKGNLKMFVVMEYLALFGISVIEICKVEYVLKDYFKSADSNIFILYRIEILSVVERHCIYARKGMLALIVLDFYQLVTNPLEFKEYSAMCNQVRRGFVMFTIVTLFLPFKYIRFVLEMLNLEMDILFAVNLMFWIRKTQLVEDLVSSSVFYVGIIIFISVLLHRMVRQEKEKESQQATNQAKVRPLILATTTFLVVMVSSYVVEMVMMLRKEILKSSSQDLVFKSDIFLQIYYYHEGVSGFVVMMSFFFWFPRLRPSLKQK